jgi:hypothetical protein
MAPRADTKLARFRSLVDEALIRGMRPDLCAALADALAGGVRVATILTGTRRITGGPHAQPGGLTYLAVEAYVRRWLADQQRGS